jgi:hypothetical protein
MPDIAKCKGDGCTLKESCHRYLAKPSMRQSYFVNPPFVEKNGKQECDSYWKISYDKKTKESPANAGKD